MEQMEQYDVIEVQGKQGVIRLHVPKREATQEEIDTLYQTVAEVVLTIYQEHQKAAEK